jgi:CRP-like cAMP-binding protein
MMASSVQDPSAERLEEIPLAINSTPTCRFGGVSGEKGGEAMYIMQKDLLSGMRKEMVKQFMDFSVKETHGKGYSLFQEGKHSSHFYILLKGCVKISLGDSGHTVYTVDHPGEAFGWSSLLGRPTYSASAECNEPTKLLKFDATKLRDLLEKNPADGFIFFKHLAETLGNRLLQTYRRISGAPQAQASTSFGTGQVMETEATTA